jgi:hypothetical protein
MKITGNKNADTIIIVGAFVGAGYILYKVLDPILKRLSAPAGGTDIEQNAGCSVGAIKGTLIKQDCDKIYSNHVGGNLWNYPEDVNKILSYDLCELQYANTYFKQTYGQTLYQNISGEWDVDGDYDAAENYLTINGLGF